MSERYTEIKWLQRRRQCWCRMPVVMVVVAGGACWNMCTQLESEVWEQNIFHLGKRAFASHSSCHFGFRTTHIFAHTHTNIYVQQWQPVFWKSRLLRLCCCHSLLFIIVYTQIHVHCTEGGWTPRKMYLCLVPLCWLDCDLKTHTHSLIWWLVILLNNIHYSNPQKPNKLCVSIACSFNEVSESEWCARVTCSSACT